MATAQELLMQYSLMDEFKAFKPADMENDDRVYEFCFHQPCVGLQIYRWWSNHHLVI